MRRSVRGSWPRRGSSGSPRSARVFAPLWPGARTDPGRYRDLIVAVSEQVLRAILGGDVSEADSNEALRAAYPEWFGQNGRADNNAHQRLSRARADVRDLLKAVVSRDELLS